MGCLKCGRETAEDQVFCQDCLLNMQRYPVRPGTPVILPRRQETSASRKPLRRRSQSAEDQIRSLRRKLRVVSALLIAAVLAAALMAYPAWQQVSGRRQRPGQNYTSITPSTTEDPQIAETVS